MADTKQTPILPTTIFQSSGMEPQPRPGVSSNQGAQAYPGVVAPPPSQPADALQMLGFILRAVAMVLALIATIVMGSAKQTKTVVTEDVFTGLTATTYTVKMNNAQAFEYFTAINAIVAAYSIISLVLSFISRSKPDGAGSVELPISIGDLVAAVVLYSCNGAATAVAVVAQSGYDDFGWDKFCDLAGKFCAQFKAAIVLSMFAAVAYLLLVVLALVRRRRPG